MLGKYAKEDELYWNNLVFGVLRAMSIYAPLLVAVALVFGKHLLQHSFGILIPLSVALCLSMAVIKGIVSAVDPSLRKAQRKSDSFSFNDCASMFSLVGVVVSVSIATISGVGALIAGTSLFLVCQVASIACAMIAKFHTFDKFFDTKKNELVGIGNSKDTELVNSYCKSGKFDAVVTALSEVGVLSVIASILLGMQAATLAIFIPAVLFSITAMMIGSSIQKHNASEKMYNNIVTIVEMEENTDNDNKKVAI